MSIPAKMSDWSFPQLSRVLNAFYSSYCLRDQLYYLVLGLGGLSSFKLLAHILTRKSYPVHRKGIVLLTGASSGIGRHGAEHLAKCGYEVIAGALNEREAEELRRANIKRLVPFVLNVTKHSDCVCVFEFVKQEMKRTGLPFVALVNNAGILYSAPVEFLSLEKARYMFETNFWGAADLVQLALPLLRESEGRIVNMSSFTGVAGPPLGGLYAASKGAVEVLSDALRREVAHFNISVSVIQPCYVATNLLSAASANAPKSKDNSDQIMMKQLYFPFYNNWVETLISFCQSVAAGVEEPAACIEHAISAKYPKTRYPVANAYGIPAWLLALAMSFASDRILDIFSYPIHT